MPQKTILIVEDNLISLRLIKKVLSQEGYNILTATSAENAQDILKEIHPDLILMDWQLPGMDGLELTQLLKTNPATRNIFIVALTICTDVGDEEKALKAGCDSYIAKPIDVITLPYKVASILNRTSS